MEGSLGFLQIEAMPFGPTNNGGQGNFLAIPPSPPSQAVFDIAVIIRLQRDVFILNGFLFDD